MSEAISNLRAIEKPGWLGPTFFWELVRQTRKGRGYFSRVLYASLLLLMLFSFLGRQDNVTQKTIAYLSEAAAQSYLLLQFLAVIFLTPIFTAGAFVEERQQRTLELLLTTHITPRELVVGKLVSRLIHVAAVLFAGLPVLAILQLLGGVNIATVLVATFFTLLTMLICGMYAIRASTLAKTAGGAIFTTYIMMLGGVFSCVPIFAISAPVVIFSLGKSSYPDTWLLIIPFVGVLLNLLFGISSLRGAILAVKKEPEVITGQTIGDAQHVTMHTQIVVRETKQQPWKLAPTQVESVREHRTERWVKIPPVSDYPIVWKEMHFPLSGLGAILTVLCCGYPLFLLLIGSADYSAKSMSGPLLTFLFWAVKTNMMLLLLMATFKAVGMFSQERLQQTMAALFTLPLSHREIMVQKGLGSIMRFRAFFIHTYLLMLAYLIYAPIFFAPMVLLFTAQLAFCLALGLFLSLSQFSPFVSKLVVGTFFFLAYFVSPNFFDQIMLYSSPSLSQYIFLLLISPYSAWSIVTFPEETRGAFRFLMANSVYDAVILLCAALILLLLTLLFLFLNLRALRRWQERLA